MGDLGARIASAVHAARLARRRRGGAAPAAAHPTAGDVRIELDAEHRVVVPTADEALRIKAYLVVHRNAVRDYLDAVALAEHLGYDHAIATLAVIDDYYDDRSGEHGSVLTTLALRLALPAPRDAEVTRELPRYKELAERWHDWTAVVTACEHLALGLAGADR